MNRYKIINLETGGQYAFTDSDLADKGFTLERWLERKANAYGENPQVVVEDMTPEIEAQRIAKLWQQADDIASAAFDHNSRAKALSWKVDGSPQWRLDRIAAIDQWMDMVWGAYFQAKADPQADELPALPPCPYSFSDLLSE